MPKHRYQHELFRARRQRGLSPKQVTRLIGKRRSTASISRWENGRAVPDLLGALQLEIIYRRPVAFLFPELYVELREDIRKREGVAAKQETSRRRAL